MLGENIKTLRTRKGMSQEILAQRMNVVRQTVSKWEKGLSVPDAEMLTRLSEILEIPVAELLGASVPNAADTNEIASQLAVLNEYLAARSRRRHAVWKGLLIAVLAVAVFLLLSAILLTASW